MTILRCPHCGGLVPPPPKQVVRICAKCDKTIDRHHKYVTVMVKQKPPRFEFHHRICDDPEAYVKRGKDSA